MAIGDFRRSVFGAVTAYAAVAFVTLLAADVFLPSLLFPDWVFRFLVILALLGLPVTAITVWFLRRGSADPAAGPTPFARRRRPQARLVFASIVFLAVVGSLAAFMNARPEDIPVRERDWIVLADCTDETGEQGIDRALTDALLYGLHESHHVNVLPRNRVAEAIDRMQRDARAPVTREVAIELAQREGVPGVLTCGIGRAGDGYIFSTAIVNPQTAEVAWSHVDESDTRDQLLRTIERVAREVRAALGESRTALWREATSLARVTTSSIEALKMYTEGQRAWTEGEYPRAAELYEAAVQRDSLFARAHAALGSYYHWIGNREKGEAHLQRAERQISRVTEREGLWLVAYIRAARSDRDGAVPAYQAYLQAYPDDRDGWYGLGNVLMFQNRCAQAIPAYRRALEIDSLFTSAWVNTGTCYGRDRQFTESLPYLLRAGKLNGQMFNVGNLNHELGSTYLALGDTARARAIFLRRLEEKPYEQAGAHRSLGLMEAYHGRYLAAARELREAIGLARTAGTPLAEVRNRLYLAAIAKRAGSIEDAQAELVRVTEIADTFYLEPRWFEVLARLQLSLGHTQQARNAFGKTRERAKAENQDDVVALNLLDGQLQLQAGNVAGAIERLELALSFRPDGYARDPLARAYLAADKRDRAAALYETTANAPELLWEGQESWFDSHLQLARLAELRKDTTSALRYYSKLLDFWRNADVEFPDLRYARQRVRALSLPRDVGRE